MCTGDGEEEQPSEDGPLPPAPPRAPGDGPLPTGLHDEDVPRVQGEGADEEGQYFSTGISSNKAFSFSFLFLFFNRVRGSNTFDFCTPGYWPLRGHREGSDCPHQAALRRPKVPGSLRLVVMAGMLSVEGYSPFYIFYIPPPASISIFPFKWAVFKNVF